MGVQTTPIPNKQIPNKHLEFVQIILNRSLLVDIITFYLIYQTRETVFHHISKHLEESCQYDA